MESTTNLNAVKLTGTLGREPEFKEAVPARHDALTSLSIAHNTYARTEDGRIEKTNTEWFRVVAWGPLAVEIARSLAKGDTIQVFGRLSSRSYEDKPSGKTVTKVEIVMSSFKLLRKKSGATSGAEDMGGEGGEEVEARAETETPPPVKAQASHKGHSTKNQGQTTKETPSRTRQPEGINPSDQPTPKPSRRRGIVYKGTVEE